MMLAGRTNSYALRTLAAVILTSGLIRLTSFDITVQAQANSVAMEAPEKVLGIPFSAEAIDRVLDAFKARESLLLADEERLENRRQTLNRTKNDIMEKIDELTVMEQRLAATLSLAETAAEQDLDRLARVYENMKPKDAAELFTEMTPDFAAGFLSLMPPDVAAAVMAELEPNIGHSISVISAGRNVNAFKD